MFPDEGCNRFSIGVPANISRISCTHNQIDCQAKIFAIPADGGVAKLCAICYIRTPMPNIKNMPNIILASQSPRRKFLLEQAGLPFVVIPGNFDEESIPLSKPVTYVKILAREKAGLIAETYPDSWVIGADTVVCIDGTVLGKPRSKKEARRMLNRLGGQTHQVLTGYALIRKTDGKCFTDVVKTDVRFKNLSDEEIEWYLRTREPFDKAGAYAIQGLGTFLVRDIKGSYTNVVGLPVCEIIELLQREGVIQPGREERWESVIADNS